MGAPTLPHPARPRGAISSPDRPMMVEADAWDRSGLPAEHVRLYLIDGVPAEPLGQRQNAVEAFPAVRPSRAAGMTLRHRPDVPGTADLLEALTADDAQALILCHCREQ